MSHESELLTHGRWLHDALRHAIEDGDGRGEDPEWLTKRRPPFEHYTSGMYLVGCISYLEGRYGVKPWHKPRPHGLTFDNFLTTLSPGRKANYKKQHISADTLDALVCIRNAFTHNGNDLAKNLDKDSLKIVQNANVPGVTINGTEVTLISNDTVDFMQCVRLGFLAVTEYFGDL